LWKFYQEHRQEIEDHKNAQAVYSSLDGKMPTLKELTAEYDDLKKRKENDQATLDELKPKLTDLKHIRYNYENLERDAAPNSHQHVILKEVRKPSPMPIMATPTVICDFC